MNFTNRIVNADANGGSTEMCRSHRCSIRYQYVLRINFVGTLSYVVIISHTESLAGVKNILTTCGPKHLPKKLSLHSNCTEQRVVL